MFKLFQNLFRSQVQEDPESERIATRDANPVVTAGIMGQADGLKASAGGWETEPAKEEYEQFCAQFCLEPDRPFMQSLADPDGKLKSWLSWDCPEAEPKAFVRLMLLLMKEGRSLRDEPGVIMLLEGRWSQGGGPPEQTDEALRLLAQAINKPIKYYFHKQPESPTLVIEYLPVADQSSDGAVCA